MNSRELIRMIEEGGWFLVLAKGSHHHFKHLTRPGLVTLPHPKGTVAPVTVANLLKQAGLNK